jgi:hypothetical protein
MSHKYINNLVDYLHNVVCKLPVHQYNGRIFIRIFGILLRMSLECKHFRRTQQIS